MKKQKFIAYIVCTVILTSYIFSNSAYADIPPKQDRKLIGFDTETITDTFFQHTFVTIQVFEDWKLLDSGSVACKSTHDRTISVTTGVSKTDIQELAATIGGHIGVKDVAGLSSEIKERTQTSITITKETTTTDRFKITAGDDEIIDFAWYQKMHEIKIRVVGGGLSNFDISYTLIIPQNQFDHKQHEHEIPCLFTIPESPIGAISMVGASMGIFGAFIYLRRRSTSAI